jgi:hypothetical protein
VEAADDRWDALANSSNLPDYYEVLEVAPRARQKVVDAAYRKLIEDCHPDTHPDDPESLARAKAINEAHFVLGDPARRKAYDESRDRLASSPKGQGPTAASRSPSPAWSASNQERGPERPRPSPPPVSKRPAAGEKDPTPAGPTASVHREGFTIWMGLLGAVCVLVLAALVLPSETVYEANDSYTRVGFEGMNIWFFSGGLLVLIGVLFSGRAATIAVVSGTAALAWAAILSIAYADYHGTGTASLGPGSYAAFSCPFVATLGVAARQLAHARIRSTRQTKAARS